MWNVPLDVGLKSIAVFVHRDSSTIALTLEPLASPVPDHASLLLHVPVSDALPPRRIRRKTFRPDTRALLLTWTVNTCGNIPRDFLPHHVIVHCDGSGGTRWGVGVHIPSLAYAWTFGGSPEVLPHPLPGGQVDSATAEAMAVVCALDVAARVTLNGSTFNAVLLVVDNTALASREMSSPHRVANHHRAVLSHVYRRAEKLLKRRVAVFVMHKKLFGLGHSWAPDQIARHGREHEQPCFGPATETTTPVKFARGARGNFKGRIGPDGSMEASALGTYEIVLGPPPSRPCPI